MSTGIQWTARAYPCTGCRIAKPADAENFVIDLGANAYLCQDCARLVADIFHEKTGGLSMSLAGELHECLKLMVRHLEEEVRDGDEHLAGYHAAKSAIVRGNPYSAAFEDALTRARETMAKASEVPGLRATLDEKTHRVTQLEALLTRIVKYASEDRARTPGKTRLARALAEAENVLAEGGDRG